jgi:hypothetical protein
MGLTDSLLVLTDRLLLATCVLLAGLEGVTVSGLDGIDVPTALVAVTTKR